MKNLFINTCLILGIIIGFANLSTNQIQAQCALNESVVTYPNTPSVAYVEVYFNNNPAQINDAVIARAANTGELRGYQNVSMNNGLAYASVGIQVSTSNEEIIFSLWSATTCMEYPVQNVSIFANPGGTDGFPPNYIVLNAYTCTPPVASFTYIDNGSGMVSFDETSSIGTNGQWDFGDGNTSTTTSPSHTYVTSGSYNVCYISEDNTCGLTDTLCQVINVNTSPNTGNNVEMAFDSICAGVGASVFHEMYVASNWDSITSLSMTVGFDPALLQFVGLTSNLSNLSYNLVGNTVMISWFDFGPNGISLVDLSTLITFEFDLLDVPNTNTNLNIISAQIGKLGSPYPHNFTDMGDICLLERQSISGYIYNTNNIPMEGVNVVSSGDYINTTNTDSNGFYEFNDITQGDSIILEAWKGGNHGEGVDVADLIMIQEHELQINPFTSLFQHVASIVSTEWNTPTAGAAYEINELILGLVNEFPLGNYAFVTDSTSIITTPSVSYQDSHAVNNITSDVVNLNFTGAKLGDINGDADPTLRQGTNDGEIAIGVSDISVSPNGEVIINCQFLNPNEIQTKGVQSTVFWDSSVLQFVGIEELNDNFPSFDINSNFNTNNSSEGKLSFTQFSTNPVMVNDFIFSLKFNVIGTIGSQSPLEFNSMITELKAYDNELNPITIENIGGIITVEETSHLELPETYEFVCSPNPFTDHINIGLTSPESGELDFTLFDISGKLIQSTTFSITSGNQNLVLENLGQLPNGSYQLVINDKNNRKRVISLIKS